MKKLCSFYLILLLGLLTACGSPTKEEILAEEREILDFSYLDSNFLEVDDYTAIEEGYKELLDKNKGEFVRWTGYVIENYKHVNTIDFGLDLIPSVNAKFEYDIKEEVKEGKYKVGDLITITGELKDYLGYSDPRYWVIVNSRIEETSEKDKATLVSFEKAVTEKKDTIQKNNAQAAANSLQEEINFYQNEVKSKLTAVETKADELWDTYWISTFDKIANGEIDTFTAYKNMTTLNNELDLLKNELSQLDLSGLSSANQKLIKKYRTNFDGEIDTKYWAIRTAKKMFDTGEVKPSQLDSIKSDLHAAEQKMLESFAYKYEVEMNLGIAE